MHMSKNNYENLSVVLNYPTDMEGLQTSVSQWIGNIYGKILGELALGKIHPMVFHILTDEEFLRCFGYAKENFQDLSKETPNP